MVDIQSFRGLRPVIQKNKSDISHFICPPYDVISPAERENIVKRSPTNVIQLELPSGEGEAKYSNAASIMKKWIDVDVIQKDRKPSFYLLETTYRINDPFAPQKPLKRYGVLVALKLETPGKGSVKPHEKTLPKAKEDRLHLLRAVQTNVSPIFGLFFDKKNDWSRWIAPLIKQKPLAKGKEKKDLDHKLWKIDDVKVHQKLQKLLKSKELYIADGHHRYEVAWAYKGEQLTVNPQAEAHEGSNYVMAYVCPMEEKGLLMLPTHRLVKSNKSLEEWKNHLSSIFDFTPVKNVAALVKVLANTKRAVRTLGYVTKEGSFTLTLKSQISIDRCLEHRPEALRALDVVLLHDIALGEAAGINFLTEKELIYTRNLKEIDEKINQENGWVGFMLGSPGVESLASVAKAGEVMPPKTTYFYPKVPTGFTMMPLNQRI